MACGETWLSGSASGPLLEPKRGLVSHEGKTCPATAPACGAGLDPQPPAGWASSAAKVPRGSGEDDHVPRGACSAALQGLTGSIHKTGQPGACNGTVCVHCPDMAAGGVGVKQCPWARGEEREAPLVGCTLLHMWQNAGASLSSWPPLPTLHPSLSTLALCSGTSGQRAVSGHLLGSLTPISRASEER